MSTRLNRIPGYAIIGATEDCQPTKNQPENDPSKEEMNMGEKMRLVTRSDFDGLACAMMLKELDLIDDIKFVHPKDVQD